MRGLAVVLLALALVSPAPGAHQSTLKGRLDREWKILRNQKYGICIGYPADLLDVFTGFNGDGSTLTPEKLARGGQAYPPVTEFGFGGWTVQAPIHVPRPGVIIKGRPLTLEQDLASLVQATRETYHARDFRILTKERTVIKGLPSLKVAAQFQDGLSGEVVYWWEKLVHTKDGETAYHLGLTCRKDEFAELYPIYAEMLSTFRVDCAK